MRAYELTELRDASLEYFKKKFPKMPDYVVQDWIYKGFKNNPKEIEEFPQEYFDMDWKKETVNITLDIFDQDTQRKIKDRAGGSKNPFEVPNDAERHDTQKNILQKSGPSKEPIILIKTNGGYELLEGWHRTLQSMQMWPKGYEQVAWIGY